MAQTHDEHLTTEQLSAAFDKQLSPQEQAIFDAHIATCKQCQGNLANLRLTVVLLRALPAEEVPRSFVLPGNLAIVPDRTIGQEATISTVPRRQPARISTLQRSIRVVSTLAAVLALFFILSGILPLISIGRTGSATTTSSSGESSQNHPAARTGINATPTIPSHEKVATTAPTPLKANTLTPPSNTTEKTSQGTQTNRGPSIPPVLDPGQPSGRLGLGIVLFILGMIGLLFTRRRHPTTT